MPLVYSLVARGNDVLADHAAFSGNVKQIAGDLLPKVEADKCTFTAQQHTFNFLRVQPFSFLVVADEAFGRQLPFAFLDRVSQEFVTKHGTIATTAPPGSFQKIFGPQLKQHMVSKAQRATSAATMPQANSVCSCGHSCSIAHICC